MIVQDGNYYAVKREQRCYVLYYGKCKEPLDSAQRRILPLGLSHKGPLSWDVYRGNLYALQEGEFAVAAPSENLKKIRISTLPELSEMKNLTQILIEGAIGNNMADNIPYVKHSEAYSGKGLLNFDIQAASDSVLYQVVYSDSLLLFYRLNDKGWNTLVKQRRFLVEPFRMFSLIDQIYILDEKGNCFDMLNKEEKRTRMPFETSLLLIDKNRGSLSYISESALTKGSSIPEIFIPEKAQKIIEYSNSKK